MNESALLKALEQASPSSGLIFQAIFQDNILYLYINRPAQLALAYEVLSDRVHAIVISLEIPELQGLWLYGRMLGETVPEWDCFLEIAPISDAADEPTELFAQVSAQVSQDPKQDSEQPSEDFSIPLEDAVLATDKPEALTKAQERDEAIAPLPLASNDEPLTHALAEEHHDHWAAIDEAPLMEVEPEFNLKQYCFTRNRALLTSEVLPPAPSVAQLILDFHALSETDQRNLLPCLDQFFRSSARAGVEQFSDTAQSWFETLAQMTGQDSRKAAIWLSRYCYDSTTTISTLKNVLHPQAVPASTTTPSDQSHDASLNTSAEPTQFSTDDRQSNYSATASNPAGSRSVQSSARMGSGPKFTWQVLLIPIAWLLFTMCVVSWNVQASSGMGAISSFCKSATGDQSYCKLAGQIVSLHVLEPLKTGGTAFTPAAKETAIHDCVQASETTEKVVEAKLSQATSSPHSEEIFPGVLVVDLQPQQEQVQSSVRNACVFTQIQEEPTNEQSTPTYGPELLEHAEIPLEWPRVPFQNKTTMAALDQTITAHSAFSFLGTNTLFTAVGILGVSFCRLSIQVGSVNGLYKAALLTGISETLLGFIPLASLFLRLKVIAALWIASIFVEDLEIDWSRGRWVLSLSVFLLVLIRSLLDWAFLTTIFKFAS